MVSASITSIKDEHVALVRALDTRARRREQHRCVLEGAALVEQAALAGADLEFALVAEPAGPLARTLQERGVRVLTAKEKLLSQALRTQRPVEWLAVARLPQRDAPYGEFAVVLDNVLDPGNLGSIVRTACGLGTPDIVCTSPDTDLTSRKVVDASRGAVLRARIHEYDSFAAAAADLRQRGFSLVATSPRGRRLECAAWSGEPLALVVGNETDGSGEDVLAQADQVVRIPMAGEVESLNVGVATGIGVYELVRRMGRLDRPRAELDAAAHEASQVLGHNDESTALSGFSAQEREQLLGYLARIRDNG